MGTSGTDSREVYFEFIVIGRQVRVTAVDAATGVEVSAVGPARAAMSDLKGLALAKLRARLKAQ